MILNNYKKSFEDGNKIIDNKNINKFICNIDKNLKNNWNNIYWESFSY